MLVNVYMPTVEGMRLTSTISSSLELSSASIATSVVSGSVSLPFPLTSVFSAGADILTVVLCCVCECGVSWWRKRGCES